MALDLAIVGGTGLYQFPGLENVTRREIGTPFGATSAPVVCGEIGGRAVGFLARHGEGHSVPPHRVNYRANVWALHSLGARRVIGVNAVGGIRADMGPRVVAIPDQVIDYTHGRLTSFCDVDGAEVKHIDFSEPYSAALRRDLLAAAAAAGVPVVDGGCYGATQGPRLETRAEIARLRRDGCDLVGMTGMPEAALARELDLDYACIALIANWAAGCGDEAEISLEEIFANLREATATVPKIIAALLSR
ncbi:MAG: 5'-methylthioadenosine phosphorylase [Lysobacterales bacterium 69-70]|nr:S-methyl-5'-thioinosine phosphorylase [Xanthomonadaceae bacterium]ODU31999.1 MAG: 5'-methylthioadenosine phosphorylase [Xanthomonadaceae bacterium SCN 69-320]ODV20054.1 MAG: 5'-methylthioadenosine phosphorylase [Xanthomonadaceae bacterium SCN 69-25]OJZ01722.1 MAG: 5'-methylthioadenosine phosphorylase [Xanthomonadales bacterium 69-70]